MLAVDTNVLVRFVARDDAEQTRRADEIFRENRIWIAKTVLLETEWVLRRRYLLRTTMIERAFRGLGGVLTVELEDAPAVAQALDWFAAGMDFADALHVASAGNARAFATFDRKLWSAGRRLSRMEIVTLT